MTLRKKMLLSVGGLTGLLLVVLQALSLYGARTFSRASHRETSLLLARYQAERVDSSLAFAETNSEAILGAVELSNLLADRPHLMAYLSEIMAGNQRISALELHPPNAPVIVLRRTADGQLTEAEPVYGEEQLRGRTLQEQIDGVWSVSGRSMEIARAYHLQSRNGVRLFIEIPFHLLSEPIEVGAGTAYGFLATESKLYFDARLAGLQENQDWSEFSNQVLLGPIEGEGFSVKADPLHHRPAWVGAAKVGNLPLKAGVVYSESGQFDLVRELVLWTIGLSVLGVILILVVTNLLTRDIVAPLEKLCAKVDAAAERDFEGKIDAVPGASSEVVVLARSFNRLMDDVRHHMSELEAAVTKRQALESELSIASRIQESILPDFPFTSEVAEATGLSRPARQVGGDFLGVFPVDDERIGFFLGDVSGKGVPAAIYMAFTASLLEHLGRLNVSPEESVSIVNKALCNRHETTMFCTVFFGILYRSGELRYCNAGHHPPLLWRKSGELEEVEVESGLGLGILEDFQYGESTFQLQDGEALFLYTDGLTEAMNESKEEYGEDRLREFLTSAREAETHCELLKMLNQAVDGFRNGAEPNDDFTVMLISKKG